MRRNRNPLVSIVIPVYNVGSKFLSRCFESIIKQTYKNFEVIIVYDESIDDSGIMCRRYTEKYPYFKLLYNKNRGGISRARNVGIKESSGEFVTFIDGDDWIDKDYLLWLIKPLLNDNTIDVTIIGANRCFDNGLVIKRSTIDSPFIMNRVEALEMLLERKVFDWTVWGKMYRRKIFDSYRFSDALSVGEDFDGTWNLFRISSKFYFTGKYGYYYFVRNSSLSHNNEYLRCHMIFFRSFCNIIHSCRNSDCDRILGLMYHTFLESFYGVIKSSLYRVDTKKEEQEFLYDEFLIDIRKAISHLNSAWIKKDLEIQFAGGYENFVKTQKERIQKLRECSRLYIYGSGDYAKAVAKYFNDNDISFCCFVVSDTQPIGNLPDGVHNVIHLKEVSDINHAEFYLSMSMRFIIEILPDLERAKKIWLW